MCERQASAEVPVGYVMMPVEPTEGMLKAAASELLTFDMTCPIEPTLRDIYSVMIEEAGRSAHRTI